MPVLDERWDDGDGWRYRTISITREDAAEILTKYAEEGTTVSAMFTNGDSYEGKLVFVKDAHEGDEGFALRIHDDIPPLFAFSIAGVFGIDQRRDDGMPHLNLVKSRTTFNMPTRRRKVMRLLTGE